MNIYFIIGSVLTAIAAVVHIGCIVFGAPWYRFFGAGERMAVLADQRSLIPTLITSVIIAVLVIWSLYALSGAGVIVAFPFLRPVLVGITGIYLLRGLIGLVFVIYPVAGNSAKFWLWSSIICIGLGIVYLCGILNS